MFIGRTDILLIERSKFGADIFYPALAGSYTMGKLLEFGVVLPAEGTCEVVCVVSRQHISMAHEVARTAHQLVHVRRELAHGA